MTSTFDPLAPQAPNQFLQLMFEAHGVPCTVQGDAVTFTDRTERIRGAIAPPPGLRPTPNLVILQFDVALEFADGCILWESCAGIADNRLDAAKDALLGFSSGSFHVLVAAFFGSCPHVISERWSIGGYDWTATMSGLLYRGTVPEQENLVAECLTKFQQAIERQSLSHQMHWIRLFHLRSAHGGETYEVLLDNEPWPQMQAAIATYPWPSTETYYSVRSFMVLQLISSPNTEQ